MDSGSPPRSSSLAKLYGEIKTRKVRQKLAIYLSAALTILGVTNLFSGVYHLPAVIFDVVLVIFLCGFPCAVTAVWLHGAEVRQKFRWPEIAVYGFFVILGTVIVLRITGTPGARLLPANAKSIAVLPFVNLSDSKDDEYFSDGVTEDIITQLSKIANLRVISRTSTLQYKNAKKSIREIAQELDVAHVLEGSIRRAGGRVRIVGQLIDARNDNHLWAETYDRDMSDVFTIQSEVARNIARALQATLSPLELQRIEKHTTESLDAYGYYLRGRDYYYRYTKQDNERAIELFRKALEVDPRYALAFAGIGDAYGLRVTRYGFGSEWTDSAIAISTYSIALDPTLAEGYKALGLALETEGKTRDALQQYYRAVELNPNYAPVLANIGSVNFTLGRYDEALPWVKKAVTLQPGSAHYYTLVGLQYFSLAFDSAAGHWLSRALALQPEMVFPGILMTYVELYQGNAEKARTRINDLVASHPDENAVLDAAGDVELLAGRYDRAVQHYSNACKRSGIASPSGVKLSYALLRVRKTAEARKDLNEILSAFDTSGVQYSEGSLVPYILAEAYSVKRNTGNSVRWLLRAMALGYRDYRWASTDPLLENLKADPEGAKALASLKEQFDSMRSRVIATDEQE
jgi:TolB-like protein/Tfp pilus assembly protein PilF